MANLFLLFLSAACVVCSTHDVNLTPYEIKVDSAQIQSLHERLDDITWPTDLADVDSYDWKYGTPLGVIRELVSHLRFEYNYVEQVAKLNEFPHFMARVSEFDVHFIHQRSSNENAVPLLFVHGWPGSFLECTKVIPLLTEPQLFGGDASNAFHVVCPSIPGYGFSPAPTSSSFDQQKCAEVLNTLMIDVLNYDEFYLQGGDWGSVVTSLMAALPNSSQHIKGLHLNMVPAMPPINKGIWSLFKLVGSLLFPWWYYSAEERASLLALPHRMLMETGYFHEQSTRPMTLSYGLSDSPVGLLAWIVEKYYAWSDCGDDLYTRFSKDELLTNFMIYWTTNSAGTSSSALWLFNGAVVWYTC
mmetsp:Transcript_3916/g.6612  ORF Transcript_3916/g.6612 Transcript_3916/m.6612 type:complete len:358 (+) Transcript_3916:79-1152(+)